MSWTLAIALLAAAPQTTRLAVAPLVSHGASAEAMQQLDAALHIELSRIDRVRVVRTPVDSSGCGSDLACLTAFGRAALAEEVIFGEVRELPDSYAVTLNVLEVATGRVKATATESVNRDVEEMVWATRAQVVHLEAPERYAGKLLLRSGTDVFVDGTKIPVPGELVLSPATHDVRVRCGSRTADRWVEVRFEHTTELTCDPRSDQLAVRHVSWAPSAGLRLSDLNPSGSLPPSQARAEGRQRWAAYAALAAGAGLAGAGAWQHLRASALRDDADRLRVGSSTFRADAAAEAAAIGERAATARSLGWILVGAGAAAVGGGACLLLWPSSEAGAGVAVAGQF